MGYYNCLLSVKILNDETEVCFYFKSGIQKIRERLSFVEFS